MDAFTYIISSFLLNNNKCLSFDTLNKGIQHDIVAYGLLSSLNTRSNKSKLETVKSYVIDGVFITTEDKERLMSLFNKSQKIYYGFAKLARVFKVKHAIIFDLDNDICMNPLSELHESIKLDFFDVESKTLYTFRISDLITIINTSLSNSPGFFSKPSEIRNPFTNIAFTKAQLFTLYTAIKDSPYVMPFLLQQFFITYFDIPSFVKSNECFIRELAINNFVKSASEEQRYLYIMKMFSDHKSDIRGISIHDDFPKASLVNSFNEYILDFLEEVYSMNPSTRHSNRKKISKKLIKFKSLNPRYGRKIITYKYNFTQKVEPDNVFIFGNKSSYNSSRQQVVSFVDTIITEPPVKKKRKFVSKKRLSRLPRRRHNRQVYHSSLNSTQQHESENEHENEQEEYENEQEDDNEEESESEQESESDGEYERDIESDGDTEYDTDIETGSDNSSEI